MYIATYVVLSNHEIFNCGLLISAGSTMVPSSYLLWYYCLVSYDYTIYILHICGIKFVVPGFHIVLEYRLVS